MTDNQEKSNFWATLPKTFTALATLITAIAGAIGGVAISKHDSVKPPSDPVSFQSQQNSPSSEYPDISGAWKMDNGSDRGDAIIDQDKNGKLFNVSLDDRRSQSKGSFIDKSKLKVLFQNDPGCCTGTLEGNQINWSNHTTWYKK